MTIRIATAIAASLALLGGCADLMGRSVVAPDWFEAKADEVKGQGYPDLYEVPVASAFTPSEQWEAAAEELKAEAAPLRDPAAAQDRALSSAEIRARAAQLRAGVTDGSEVTGETQEP